VELLHLSWRAHLRQGLVRRYLLGCDTLLLVAQSADEVVQLRLCRAGALRALGLVEDAFADAQVAMVLADEHGLPWLGRATGNAGIFAQNLSLWDQAEALLSRGAELTRVSDPRLCCGYLADLGTQYWTLGDAERGLLVAREAAKLVRRHDLEQVCWGPSLAVARILLGLGRHVEAVTRLERLITQHSAPESACMPTLILASAMLDRGRLDEAEVLQAQAERCAQQTQDQVHLAQVDGSRGASAAMRGDWPGAYAYFTRAIEAFEDAGLGHHTIIPRCWAAVTLHRMGEVVGARELMASVRQQLPDHRATLGPVAVVAMAEQVVGLGPPPKALPVRTFAFVRIARGAWGHTMLPGAA
jgi:tetratricopeptide (TPR) repeat protein